jgi:hypothetical protein
VTDIMGDALTTSNCVEFAGYAVTIKCMLIQHFRLYCGLPIRHSLRTTNGANSFYEQLNSQLYSSHPNICILVTIVPHVQSSSCITIISAEFGICHERKSRQKNIFLLLRSQPEYTHRSISSLLQQSSRKHQSRGYSCKFLL